MGWFYDRVSVRPGCDPSLPTLYCLIDFDEYSTFRFNEEGRGESEPYSKAGTLYRLDPDLSLHVMVTDITIPNGIGCESHQYPR